MTWNVRVVLHRQKGESLYTFHEVHYDADGRVNGMTVDPVEPHGETLAELRTSLAMYIRAMEMPFLDYADATEKEIPPVPPQSK